MNPNFLVGLAVVASAAACSSPGVSVQAGYTQLEVGGSVALSTGAGGGTGTVEQDIGTGFGLGDARGSPFLRVDADFGGPILSASGFRLAERGSGVLAANFGGLAQATPVTSELDVGAAKLAAVWDLDLGIVRLAPGLALDVFDFDFRVSDRFGNSEVIDEVVAVPMVVLRATSQIGSLHLLGELGYVEAPRDGATNRFLDAEAMIGWSVSSRARLLAGYRYIDVDATGDTGSETFGIDLRITGWFVGGGITF